MSLSSSQIDHLAKLARLTLTPTEKTKFSKEISSILDYVNQLKELKGGFPCHSHPASRCGVNSSGNPAISLSSRADKIENRDPATVKQILKNAPETEGNLFKVKGVF